MSSIILSTATMADEGLAPGYQPFKARYDLQSLVKDIKQYLGESGGISSEEIDSEHLISLARKYVSDPADWMEIFHNDTSKNYTRNTIENINHKANILLLVWNPGKGSPIHDHANAHCIMKILAGELHETVYNSPENGGDDTRSMTIKSSRTFGTNEVTYISDDIGVHRVHNPRSDRVAVSLHLYTPPNAADIGYNIFDQSTGRSTHVSQAHSV